MGERVNIQYSIDLEELDGELRRLLERSNGCLKYSQEELHTLVGSLSESDLLQHSTVEKIGDIRERLAKVDFILSDVNKIIGAYISYQLKKEEVSRRRITPNTRAFPKGRARNKLKRRPRSFNRASRMAILLFWAN